MSVSQIVDGANRIAQRQGSGIRHTPKQVASLLTRNDEFKWVGLSTYGLAAWDIGHSAERRLGEKRTTVAAEIVHLLRQSDQPLSVRAIKDHIAQRFQLAEGTIEAALRRYNGREFIIDDDKTVKLAPGHRNLHNP